MICRLFLPLALTFTMGCTTIQPLQTVTAVDLGRYAGTWYEVARLPNYFQRQCAANVKATYTLRNDGNIDVLNQCNDEDGNVKAAKGLARSTNPPINTQLKVSFFNLLGIRPFGGDYWIIDLDKDYRYAVIGDPDRHYAWLLSRTPTLPDDVIQQARDVLDQQGFPTDQLLFTTQTISPE